MVGIGGVAMNRKQRRSAVKLAKQGVFRSDLGATIGLSAQIAELAATAQQFKQEGKLNEAVAIYQRALALQPNLTELHYYLGNTLRQQNKFDEATAHYRRAVALRPTFAEAHNNLGNALRIQGHLDEAMAYYKKAVALKPDFAEAHNNLGNALQDQGQVEQAAAQYRSALAINPNFVEAHNNLGNSLSRQSNLDEAIIEYKRALVLRPDFAEAHNNLGTVFHDQGKLAEAVAQYRRALTLAPRYAEAESNLGKALLSAGEPAEALRAIQRSIEIAKSPNSKRIFVECLRSLNFVPEGVDLRNDLIHALSEPWGRPSDIARFAVIFLKLCGTTGQCIRRVNDAWPKRPATQQILFSPAELAEICDDELLLCVLRSAVVCDIELERFLTAARQNLLEMLASAERHTQSVEQHVLRVFCALAHQCFINEYAFAYTEDEKQQVDLLRGRLVDALASGTSIPEHWLVAVAAYIPLATLPAAELLVKRPWSASVADLLARQVREPNQERQLQSSVPRLTSVDDPVSLAVQQQYEENPYPRWVKVAPGDKSPTVEAYLRHRFPLGDFGTSTTSRAEVLIAGCGTGQHSIETAQRFPGAQILAIDLSLASLCYAKRKTSELGLTNIEYARADILQLRPLGRVFDVIEATGVLHHLAHPTDGWLALLSMLRPGGFMRLGLYSKLARKDLTATRSFIAQRGYAAFADDIRRFRQELMASDDTQIMKVTELVDFFSTSNCRDLLFHVQEHQFQLPEIDSFLHQHRLEFLGFELPGMVLQSFRRRFPDSKTMTDLSRWHIFETENPSTFVGMYQFWVRKRSSL
jgi:tetratricopeptide (TPR) repeat protein/2-polyprenyl-3-methyl-5-hydroxy-6-metoxy-1,4-benzoquinol methylase